MIKGLTMIIPEVAANMSKNNSERTGYNAPVLAFDSRRICLMEFLAGNFRLILKYCAKV